MELSSGEIQRKEKGIFSTQKKIIRIMASVKKRIL
jgi:hypothetical protein